ncbi:MAG: DNA polymerase III subunit delta [Desulfobacterales bacterium RIFOXYA12_FULL_46_15]|nr:MAG: DNA polymerase III subunit delta [Desulfobacterales bacterium RIFOXYA12_FULL_46_15]
MPLVRYDQFEAILESFQKKGNPPGLFLIFGDSYLIKQIFSKLSEYLIGKDKKEFALETLEGGSVSIGDIIEASSTFSFLFSKKIVAVKNAPLFQSHNNNADIVFSSADLERLTSFIVKAGLPSNHYLILMTGEIDKRRKSYKALEENGLVIDCSVAEGVRKADQDEQEKVFQTVSDRILSKAGKTIGRQAFHLLIDLTGFDLELFAGNLEKLIIYSGDRNTISPEDVHAVVTRDKKDPIFKLTNAFIEKDVRSALFFLNSILKDGAHPLQILKVFENQIRKLILVKCGITKITRKNKKLNFKHINFNLFKQTILPEILVYDNQMKAKFEAWKIFLSEKEIKGKTSTSNDLLLASNPQNAYPVFQIFQKSENFSLNELRHILIFLSDLDYRLKSSSFDVKTALESFIIKTCSKGGFVYVNENKNRRYHF